MPSYRQFLPLRGPHGWSLFIAKGGARREKGDFNVISGLVFLGRAASLVQGCTLYRVVGRNLKVAERPRLRYRPSVGVPETFGG